MSMNPCKNGDREKDQNNNFVNSTAHGGAGVDREGRARRAAARSAVGEEGSHPQQQQLTRNSDTRRDQHNGYYQHGQQRDLQRSPAGRATGGAGGGGAATGGGAGPQVTAKVMWGNVSAIKELRDKEQTDRQYGTRAAGRRQ